MKAGLLAAALLFTALGGAHGATCGDKDGAGGGPVTDAECEAYQTGYVYDSFYASSSCSNDPCSGSDLAWCCTYSYNSNANTYNYNANTNTNTALGGDLDECDYAKTWYNMVTTFSFVGAVIAIVGIGA